MSEQTEFLKDLEVTEEDVLEQPLETEETGEKPIEAEESKESQETEMKLKTRRERRLSEKLQAEREANIDLNARLQTISEAKKAVGEEADYLKKVERIYGNNTPEAKEATEILKEVLRDVHQSARREALEESLQKFNEQRDSEAKETAKEEQNLEEMLENLEDEHNADFSDTNTRKGFLTLLERLSPKDKDGNIVEYADPETTWEIYESRNQKSNRAKELSSRSMTRSGTSQPSKLEDDATVRYLKENGILWIV